MSRVGRCEKPAAGQGQNQPHRKTSTDTPGTRRREPTGPQHHERMGVLVIRLKRWSTRGSPRVLQRAWIPQGAARHRWSPGRMVRDVRGAMARGTRVPRGSWLVGIGPPLNGGASRSDDSKRIRIENRRFRGARGLSSPQSGSRENNAPHHHRVDLVRGQAHLRAD